MNKKTKRTDASAAVRALMRDTVKGQKWRIFINCILSALVSVISIALALCSKEVLDIATTDRPLGRFWLFAALMLLLVIVQLLANASVQHNATVSTGRMTMYLQKRFLKTVGEKQYCAVSPYHSGDLLQRFTGDSELVASGLSNLLPTVVSTVAKLVSGAVALLLLDWRFATGLLLLGITVPTVIRGFSGKFKKIHKDVQASDGVIKAFLQEHFRNLSVIKSFASHKPLDQRFDQALQTNFKLKVKRNWLSIFTGSGFYLFFTAGYFLVLVWGAFNIKSGTTGITYGSLLAFLQIISQIRAPMQNISGLLPRYYQVIASGERLIELADLPDELSPVSDDVMNALRDVFRGITAKDLSFSYDDQPLLSHCDFTIPRGSLTAISGVSGKGKTTLFRLLLGYYQPTGGTLRLSDKYEINASTRRLFAYVPQDSMILSGTIRDNLILCNEAVSEEAIRQAVTTARLKEWIDTLPDGIDTRIGENGLGISQGQAQRLAIARALLCDSPILLLDEATDALDKQTEHDLLWALRDLPDTTVLLVTHRTIEDGLCDNRLHLENRQFTQTYTGK